MSEGIALEILAVAVGWVGKLGQVRTIAIQIWIHRFVKNRCITVPSGGNMFGYCFFLCASRSAAVNRGP
jgi:hypothetical protein